MKPDEVHFSSRTVITPFLDKPYQEINFKSHLNSVLPCKQGKLLSDLPMSSVIWLLDCVHFYNEIEKFQL